MSLIGDALKKAHLEAVRQDGSSSRMVHTPGVAQYRRDHQSEKKSWTTVLVVSNSILALVIAAVIVWGLTRDRSDAPPAAAETSQASVTAPTGPAPEATPVTPTSVARTEVPEVEPTPARVEPEAAPVTTREVPPSPSPKATTPANPPATIVPAAEPPAPVEAVEPRRARNGYIDGQTYMRSIPVPGGSELELNGMSIAGGKGVALINGRMVREGDRVGPFSVGRIADRRVELGYDGITIYLKLP